MLPAELPPETPNLPLPLQSSARACLSSPNLLEIYGQLHRLGQHFMSLDIRQLSYTICGDVHYFSHR